MLYGEQIHRGLLDRKAFMEEIGASDGTFRRVAADLGAKIKEPGLRFFDAAHDKIAFGPGAGLVLGAWVSNAA